MPSKAFNAERQIEINKTEIEELWTKIKTLRKDNKELMKFVTLTEKYTGEENGQASENES